jgi:hypothetical protein
MPDHAAEAWRNAFERTAGQLQQTGDLLAKALYRIAELEREVAEKDIALRAKNESSGGSDAPRD